LNASTESECFLNPLHAVEEQAARDVTPRHHRFHALNERLIEEFITVDVNKSGLLGLPMSNLFSISQQMYFNLNQQYNARAYIMENTTQVRVKVNTGI